MPQKPTINGREILANTGIFHIEQLDLTFSNGEHRLYQRVKGRPQPSVLILPILNENTILLAREYQAGVDDYVLQFPKGAPDEGEASLETANRELQEELGYAANNLFELITMASSPGYMTGLMTVVVAEDLYESTLLGDEPEAIEVVEWSVNKIDELIDRDDFCDARSIAALLLWERKCLS